MCVGYKVLQEIGSPAVPVRGPWSMCPETVQLSISIDWCSVKLSQQLLLLVSCVGSTSLSLSSIAGF